MPPSLTPTPAGFPKCAKCPLLSSGDPQTCVLCVAQASPLHAVRCPTCCRSTGDSPCGNPVCNWDDRDIGIVSAICKRTDPIESILKRFKYDGEDGWALILGRIVLGWLEVRTDLSETYDLITVNPTHEDRQPLRHTEMILEIAQLEDQLGRWPLDDHSDTALVKHTETESATAYGTNWHAKKAAADALRWAVSVAHPERVAGKRILVVDDVTTTLLQMNVIAGILVGAGALSVDGLVIARQGG